MRRCIATIWPSWASGWIRCGSPMRHGRCVQYGHTDQGCEPPSGRAMDETIKVWTGYVRRSQLGPEGLCGDRTEHTPHLHESPSLGRFWCTADQDQREPWRSERARALLAPAEPVALEPLPGSY